MRSLFRPLAGTTRGAYAPAITAVVALVRLAAAWGPHTEITAAALQKIPAHSPIRELLGPEWNGLTSWCWMPDRRRSLAVENGVAFLTDDFLFLPGVPPDVSHTMPSVEATWAPCFRRALDALRMETPWNAARWVGALLHFVEDTGAPPHAWPRGPHGPLENWVPAHKISIADSTLRALGEDDDSAAAAFLVAMRRHADEAAERGRQIEPLATASNRPGVEAIALVSANESANMAAAVLETLGRLASQPPALAGGELHGRLPVASGPPPPVRPKVMVAGHPWSTVCAPDGRWSLRRLPPGEYELIAALPGCSPLRARANVVAGQSTEVQFESSSAAASHGRLMNPDFSLRWTRPNAPDYWQWQKESWESEAVPVAPGERIRLLVEWTPHSTASLVVRWRNSYAPTGGRTASEPPIAPGETERELVAPDWATNARIDLLMRSGDPTNAVRRISWMPFP